jgi:mRNA interferase HigB
VIAKPRPGHFWESRTDDAERAKRDLSAWHKTASHAEWENFGALKQTFGAADQVGNCVVFDVGNNRYRLIGRVKYARPRAEGTRDARGIIFVLKVMDHKEYDKNRWPDECGCHQPPPAKAPAAGKSRQRMPLPRGRKRGK